MAVAARRLLPAIPWRQVRQVGRRFSWGIADQGVSSLTNFLLNIFVARMLGAEQFGAFTLAYVTYGFALNASRGLSIEPLLIRFSTSEVKTWRRATSGSTGTALLNGLALGCLALVAGQVIGGTTGMAFLGLGLMLPALMLQDSWRYAFFALGRGHHAFINDLIWAGVQIPLLVVLRMTGHANVFWFVLAWGAGAAAGAVAGAVQAKVVPSLIQATSWLIVHRDLGPRFLLENAGGNAADTLRSYGTSSLLGLTQTGYIQAATVLMGPLRIILYGMGLLVIPEGTRILRRSPRRLARYCVVVAGLQFFLSVMWSTVLLVGLPMGLGQAMLGPIWSHAYPLVVPSAIALLASCAGSGAGIGMHALGAAKRSMRSTLMTAAISLSLALIGTAVAGMLGTLYFAAAAAWIGTLLNWWQFRRALHESGVPVPRWLAPARGGRHQGSSAAQPRSRQAATARQDASGPGVAVSRSATARSYAYGTGDAAREQTGRGVADENHGGARGSRQPANGLAAGNLAGSRRHDHR